MERDPLSLAGLALALLLLTAPVWVLPHAGETSTTYAAERIEYGTGPDATIRAGGPIDGLACYREELTRGCLFAERIVAEGPVAVEATAPLASPRAVGDAPFVAVGTDPPFRRARVTAAGTGSDGRLRYALDPVGPRAVLANVSVARSALPATVRPVLDGETVTVHGRSFDVDGQVVRADGAYHRVYVDARTAPTWPADHPVVWAARGLPVLAGLGLLRARWRGGPSGSE